MKTTTVPKRSSKKVTLSQIAEAAGVSISAVSMALRGKDGLPAETIEHILQAAVALGYIRKPVAPVDGPRAHLRNLGLVVKADAHISPLANPFYSYITAGVEETCRRKKISLLYTVMPVDEHNQPLELPSLLTDPEVGGILLAGTFIDRTLSSILVQATRPVVLVDSYAEFGDYDSVVSDNLLSARQATLYLVERGHRHIAVLGGSPHAYPSIHERVRGYEQAMRENNLTMHYIDCEFDRLSAYRATTQALTRYPYLTAIFGVNDDLTLGAMSAAQDLGKIVPNDLSFVGFDDIEWAEKSTPPLTTMRVDKRGMGRMAVQLLSDRIEYPDSVPVTISLHARLIERESVAKI